MMSVPDAAGERERFEKWAFAAPQSVRNFTVDEGGDYLAPSVRMSWRAWQAALQAQPDALAALRELVAVWDKHGQYTDEPETHEGVTAWINAWKSARAAIKRGS